MGHQGGTRPAQDGTARLIDRHFHQRRDDFYLLAEFLGSAMLAALLSNVLMLVTGLVTSVIYDKASDALPGLTIKPALGPPIFPA